MSKGVGVICSGSVRGVGCGGALAPVCATDGCGRSIHGLHRGLLVHGLRRLLVHGLRETENEKKTERNKKNPNVS